MTNHTSRGQQRDKPFRDALRMEITALQADGDKRGLRRLARALIEKGEDGDVQAIREIADRLDGKVPQAVVGDSEHDPVGIIVTGVARAADNQD